MSFKRGFLNTPRSKRVIDEAYADVPQPPLGDSKRTKSVGEIASSPLRATQDGGGDGKATAASGAIDGSNAGNCAVAVRTAHPTESEAEQPSADDDDKTKSAALSSHEKDPKGKGKEREVDEDMEWQKLIQEADIGDVGVNYCDGPVCPPRPRPRRPGWGRPPEEDILHTVPRSHGGLHKKRAVFRAWPRDPRGIVIRPGEEPRGTLSPDGYPWGATLYDIFSVNRSPKPGISMMMTMTGSALLQWTTEMGELKAARPEIEWAKTEGKPRIEGVADTAELIESIERRLQLMRYHNFSMRDDVRENALKPASKKGKSKGAGEAVQVSAPKGDNTAVKVDSNEDHVTDNKDNGGDDKDRDGDEDDGDQKEDGDEEMGEGAVEHDDPKVDPVSIPPTMPITSPFHPSYYPAPWPFIPFENPLSILLQERIPLYLLPKTLYVHDPFNLLSARDPKFRDTSWKSRPDIIRTYNLNFSSSVRKEVKEAQRKAEELEEFKARTLIILRYKRTKEQIKNHEPIIEVPLPPYPRCLTKVEESHLYISPVSKIGDGHHSIVYKGEWELPRDVFTRPKLCRSCFKDTVDKEIQRLKDTGRWQKMLGVVGWGPTGSTGREPKQEELDEVNDPTNLERDGEIIEREITCIVPANVPPMQISQMVDKSELWDELIKNRRANAAMLNFAGPGDEEDLTDDSPVATIRLDAPVAYDRYKTCMHGPRPFDVPRTTKFTVVAKLSLENDSHLAREASNYQQFPEHFFHHYNGYTIIQQLHTIVPVGAVVPQFYGYYTPGKDQRSGPYLSPILLLEHCGKPIDPEKLSVEDQEECASLLLRFQRGSWLHESIAPRNFLVQRGKPTEFPITRDHQPDLSFRLIDFGRSKKYTTAGEKQREEMYALRMFSKLTSSMNVTMTL